ncbi:hypothetical protein AAMO2058_000482200 [Amorphochlora amoebiformis]
MARSKKSFDKKSARTKRRKSRDWDGDRRKKKDANVNPVKTDWKCPTEHMMVCNQSYRPRKLQEEEIEKSKAYVQRYIRRKKDRRLQSDIDDILAKIKETGAESIGPVVIRVSGRAYCRLSNSFTGQLAVYAPAFLPGKTNLPIVMDMAQT